MANKASPYIHGTQSVEDTLSRDIDILHESISLTVEDLYRAHYLVEYTISCDREGRQVPLVFTAINANGYGRDSVGFHVRDDGVPVKVFMIPYRVVEGENMTLDPLLHQWQWPDIITRMGRL